MHNDLVSVIVPFYNAEKYLAKCIESVLQQKYTDIELILVNNLSTDKSMSTAEDYLADTRVKIVDCNEQGVSYARNVGIKECLGKWILFLDADDYIDVEMIYDLVNEANADNVVCAETGYYKENITTEITEECYLENKENTKVKDFLELELFNSKSKIYSGYLWNKLFLSEIIKEKNIWFDTDIYYNEDRLFILKYFLMTPLDAFVKKIQKCQYHYRIFDGSAMGTINSKPLSKVITEIEAFKRMKTLLGKCTDNNSEFYNKVISEIDETSVNSCYILLRQRSFAKKSSEYQFIKSYLTGCSVRGNKMRIKRYLCTNMFSLCRLSQKRCSGMEERVKIGIVTINDPNPNYGNRLQNYAVDYVLKKMGCDVETLYVEKQLGIYERIKHTINVITGYSLSGSKAYAKYGYKKCLKFSTFNKEYIEMKRIKSFDGLNDRYDYFVVGSDQVWNPSWYDDMKKEAYLLTFADRKKKVCFSPSFGVDKLPDEWVEHFANSLREFDNISVRETAGAELVKELTGKEAEVLIDPTLMLDASEWMKIESEPLDIDCSEKYILTYFLGDKSSEALDCIDRIAKDNNLKVYNLLDIAQPEVFAAEPGEFIYLLNHSEIVLTDSFHACVFSFLFNKSFYVFKRDGHEKNMMSRLDTLFSMFGLQDRLFGEYNESKIFEHNYEAGYKMLASEREKVKEYLEKEIKKVPAWR